MEQEIEEMIRKHFDNFQKDIHQESLAKKMVALIVKVTDEIIGEDEKAIRWENPITHQVNKRGKETKRFSQKVTMLTEDSRNKVRAEMRIKRDELLK